MRLLRRDLSTVWYCNFIRKEKIVDENGYFTGETRVIYTKPKKLLANISHPAMFSRVTMFGESIDYDKTLITTDTKADFDEHSVFFIDKPVTYNDGNPVYDYNSRRVSKTPNYIAVALKKVNLS